MNEENLEIELLRRDVFFVTVVLESFSDVLDPTDPVVVSDCGVVRAAFWARIFTCKTE